MAPSVDLIGALSLHNQKVTRAMDAAKLVGMLPHGERREAMRKELEHDLTVLVASYEDVSHQIAVVRQQQ